MKELAKTYDPKGIEERLYKKWEDNGYFHAEVDRSKKPFTIVMPPPNITGQLHMGHALDNTMQDILIRYKRMQGYNVLWQPGTDHASIATEVKVIQSLKEKGIDKADLGREGFLEKCWEWREEYGNRIINQLKKLGSSADWQRERFTMDKGCSDAVQEVFIKLYEKGYIYKGSRIVNWCPVCKTSISDAEVEHEEQDGFFWHINYPVVGEEGRFVEIATTRPETLFGDTAVAVNPDDERYKDIVGKMLKLPMTDREIPVIADPYVDKEFGTGCVKITPAHDPNDFEVGKRHNLEEIVVINDDATMNKLAGKYEGMDRYECRKALVKDLEEAGLLVKVVPHSHNVGTHDRCGTTVEPMIKQQWFVKMDEMIKPAVEGVKNGEIQLLPKRMEKTYFNWTDNIRDWCISRQLWWGHRIPAYYCDECGEMVVSKEAPHKCPKCGCTHMTQDPDTLDTWFSSALWPFSTLGWPEKTEDLDYFYPNDVLVTGYDIIFFWVIRMIFPVFIAGIFLSAILAAIMSTADSQLLVTASAITEDFYHNKIRKNASEKELMWVSRGCVMAVAIIAVLIATNQNSTILGLVSYAWGGFGSAFGPLVLCSLFWRRTNKQGAYAGIIVGGVVDLVWAQLSGGIFDLYEIVPGFVFGLLAIVVVSLLTPAPTKAVTDEFDSYHHCVE